jgi:hypothetical protein
MEFLYQMDHTDCNGVMLQVTTGNHFIFVLLCNEKAWRNIQVILSCGPT